MIQSIFTFPVSWGKKVSLVVRVRRLEDWAFVDPRFTDSKMAPVSCVYQSKWVIQGKENIMLH